MNSNKQREDLEIGHLYGKESECNSFGNCDAVAKGLRTGATILMLILLGILVILGVTGHGITITIGDDVSAGSGDPEVPPSRPSEFTFHGGGGFGGGEDPISLAPLLEHKRDSQVTAEEDAILRSVFAEYDENDDGLWTYADFTNFYSDTMHSEETFAFLDSKTNDGVLDYDELVVFFTAFSSSPHLHTEAVHEFLVAATGLPLEEAVVQEAEVLTALVLEEVGHGEGGITKEEWREFGVAQQWEQFNDDKDSFVDFAEFERDFFESDTFRAMQECRQLPEYADRERARRTFEGAEIVHHHDHPHHHHHHSRRRMPVATVFLIIGAVTSIISAIADVASTSSQVANENCYSHLSLVNVLRDGKEPALVPLRDVGVGDFVWDGSDFTKVYFLQQHSQDLMVNMLAIKYGVPAEEHSVTLTAAHLLYPQGASVPVRSDEIQIGDVLWGITEHSNGIGSNFTVYDISTVQSIPVNPVTMSSDMMVDGVKTSVYSHSVEHRDALHDAAAIFRWSSANIDEAVTQKLFDFYYNTVFKKLMTKEMQQLTMSNGAVLGAVYLGVPLAIGFVVFQAVNLLFAPKSKSSAPLNL